MGDHERRHPPPPQEEPAEEQAHDQVADEAAHPLVEVVRPAQQSDDDDRGARAHPELLEAQQHEAEQDQLLDRGVLERCQHQDRVAPPHVVQVLRHHGQVQADGVRREVEQQPDAADGRRDDRAAAGVEPEVAARPPEPEAAAAQHQEVRRQRDRNHGEQHRQQLVDEVEPGPVRGEAAVHDRALLREGALGERGDEVDDGVDRRASQREQQHERDLHDQGGAQQAVGLAAQPRVGQQAGVGRGHGSQPATPLIVCIRCHRVAPGAHDLVAGQRRLTPGAAAGRSPPRRRPRWPRGARG